jgi:hypothetical protein
MKRFQKLLYRVAKSSVVSSSILENTIIHKDNYVLKVEAISQNVNAIEKRIL